MDNGGEKKSVAYGSPFGGEAINASPLMSMNFKIPQALASRPEFNRPPSGSMPIEDDLDLRIQSRIINDILQGKLKLEDLNPEGPKFDPKNSPARYFNPYA